MGKGSKHPNYDALNLIGYGLAKFDHELVSCLGFKSKAELYRCCVDLGLADTVGTVKNRQDLFDPFFSSSRKGWWQKGDAYIHRKIAIDTLFGDLDAAAFSQVVRACIAGGSGSKVGVEGEVPPIIRSQFKQLQTTGLEAESYFMTHYRRVEPFQEGRIDDARILGDGYDFQIDVGGKYFLAEVKGVRSRRGSVRMTENEYRKAIEHATDYVLVVVSSLDDIPKMSALFNPAGTLTLTPQELTSTSVTYHSPSLDWGAWRPACS